MDPPRKQSFVRGDSTRKALHRRTPSAPNTPRLDHERQAGGGGGTVNGQHKASSQPRLDSLPSSPASDSSSLLTSPVDTSLGIDIDAAIKARLQQMALQCRGGARSSDSGSPRSPEKLAGGGGGVSPASGEGEGEKRTGTGLGMGNGVVELQASPGAHRRHDPASPLEPARFFVSRYHDYAEILSDEEGGGGGPREASSAPSSATDMQELVEKLDSKLSSASRFYRRDAAAAAAEESSEPEAKHAKLDPEKPAREKEKAPHVPKQRSVERVPAAVAGGRGESPPSTQVVRRRAEWIPASESAMTAEQAGAVAADFPELPPRLLGSRDAALPPIPQHRTRLPPNAAHLHHARPGLALPPQGGAMSKCLSVPSDIARSLENITASQSDLLSSVTLSELSQSINSFCTGAPEEEGDDRCCPPSAAAPRESPRWRRSASLDSLEADSALCRSLRAINAQMDSAFHQKVELAIQLEEEGYSRHGGEDMASLTPLHISEDNLASPTTTTSAVHETHFPATPDTPTAGESPRGSATTTQPGAREAVPRSVSESGELGGREGVSSAAMSQSYPASTATTADQYADYAVVTKRQSASRSEVGVGGGFSAAQRDFPDYAFIPRRQAVCIGDSDFGPQHGNFADWENFSEDQYTAMLSRAAAAAALTPAPAPADQNAQRTSALENAHSDADSAVWSRAGETVTEASQTLSHIAQPRSPSETSRAAADSRLGDRLTARSDAGTTTTPPSSSSSSSDPGGTLRSQASATRSDASSLPRTDPSRERPSLSEVSAGVCVVKRQRNSSSSSSSGSTSSSDAGDVSDDSIEIVHQARPADAQFAMKLRGKQRAAESLPARGSPTLLPDPPRALRLLAEPADAPLPPSGADVVPGDLRQFSPDDVMWRQSPLFGRSGEFGEEFAGPEGRSPFSHSPRAERDRLEAPVGARRTENYGAATAGGGTFRTLVHPAEEAGGDCPPYHRQAPASPDSQRGSRMAQSYEGRLRGYSLPSEHKPDTSSTSTTTSSPSPSPSHSSSASSPRQEARRQVDRRARRASSQSDGALKRLAHEDVPILAGNLQLQQGPADPLASTPAAQRSHMPSPRSPTLTSPTAAPAAAQHTRLTSPRSPIISSSPAASSHHHHHHHHSRIPSPRSPTSASLPPASPSSPAAAGGGSEAAPPSVPLHLMLYHPDEFQVPPAAVGMAAGSSSSSSASLPQVHVKSDTVMEEKAVIRKGSSSSSSRTVTEPGSGQGQGWGPSGELPQPVWRHALPKELEVQRGEPVSLSSAWSQLALAAFSSVSGGAER